MKAQRRAVAIIILLALLANVAAAGCGSTPGGGNGGNGGDDPLRGLSLEQKVGQLFLVGFAGTTVTPELQQLFDTVHPGGVILFGRNIENEAQLGQLASGLQDLARADSGNPLFIAVDQEGGEVVRLGWLGDETPQAQVTTAAQAHDLAMVRGRGLSGLGVNLNLSPVLDMGVPGDFLSRYGRTFPGSAQQVGELGASAISGQHDGGAFSTAKHFPGYGGITYDPENERLAVMPTLPETSQFQVAAKAGPEFVMTANVIYEDLDPTLPFTLSPACIAYLKSCVAGDYLVVSDDLATAVLKQAYGLEGTVVRAAQAGVDVLLVSGHEAGDVQAAFAAVVAAVRDGSIAEGVVDERATRLLRLKDELPTP